MVESRSIGLDPNKKTSYERGVEGEQAFQDYTNPNNTVRAFGGVTPSVQGNALSNNLGSGQTPLQTPFDPSGVAKYGSTDYFKGLANTYQQANSGSLARGAERTRNLVGGNVGTLGGTPAPSIYAREVEQPYQAGLQGLLGGEIAGASKFFGQQLPFLESAQTGQYGGQDTITAMLQKAQQAQSLGYNPNADILGKLGMDQSLAGQRVQMTPHQQATVDAANNAQELQNIQSILGQFGGVSGLMELLSKVGGGLGGIF